MVEIVGEVGIRIGIEVEIMVGIEIGIEVGIEIVVVVGIGIEVGSVVEIGIEVEIVVEVMKKSKKGEIMKRIVTKEVEKIEGAGLESMLGEMVLIMALNYNYYGRLTGVNDACIELEDASIIYETGEWGAKNWKDIQKLPAQYWYVSVGIIESFAQVDR